MDLPHIVFSGRDFSTTNSHSAHNYADIKQGLRRET